MRLIRDIILGATRFLTNSLTLKIWGAGWGVKLLTCYPSYAMLSLSYKIGWWKMAQGDHLSLGARLQVPP